MEILKNCYEGLNLTAIKTEEEFFSKQFLDSVLPWRKLPFFRESIMESEKVIDVGFGGGLPLLPLAYEAPQRLFFGLEARRKKAEAVKAIASKMGISNVNISHGRIEDSHLTEKTVLLFRAVGKIEDCLKGLKHPVTCFFYKGPSYWEKTERIPKGWKIIFQEKISVPQTQAALS